MLEHAAKYEAELSLRFLEISDDLRFQYAWAVSYRQPFELIKNTWDGRQYVSVQDGRVIGYLGYHIDRDSDAVWGLQIINFTLEPSVTFAKDLTRFLRDIFLKYNHRKIKFSCSADNPIKPAYDRVCERFGGRIVGVEHGDDRLLDGMYHDRVLYEVMREDFVKGATVCPPHTSPPRVRSTR